MPTRLRLDIKFQLLKIGPDGYRLYRIFDPVNEKYYQVNQKAYEIIQHFSVCRSIEDIEESLKVHSIPATKEEVINVITFLKRNNLTFADPDKKAHKNLSGQIVKSYIYFKFPLWRPDRFLSNTKLIGQVFLNKYFVCLSTVWAVFGFLLLIKFHKNFLEGFSSTFNLASVKFFIPIIILVKIIHELSHAYTAKLLGSKVRCMGVAFIFLTPRFYTDISDMITLDKISRIKIALAGMWVELIIGGLACFFFIAVPLHSNVSQICVSFITVSLVSSLFFNGNPLMRFDAYYVLKELMGIENLYSNSSQALKAFWRRIILGLKSATQVNLRLLIYGHLSLFYRIFIYTSIIILVYQFFIKTLALILVLISIWIFLVKPVLSEIVFVFKKWKQIKILNKLYAFSFLCGLSFLFFVEMSLPSTHPAFYSSAQLKIRARIGGTVKDLNDKQIILDMPEISHRINLLEKDLALIQLKKRQRLSEKKYALLSILKAMEERIKFSLKEEKVKLLKLHINLPKEAQLFVEKSELIGAYVNEGDELAYVSQDKKVYVYFDANLKDRINEGMLYFKKRFAGASCKLVADSNDVVRYIPPQISSLHGGDIQTDSQYRPIKPLRRAIYQLDGNFPDYDSSCYFVHYRKVRLFNEIRNVLKKIFHDEFL